MVPVVVIPNRFTEFGTTAGDQTIIFLAAIYE
jgi:hypothetical protein